MRVKDDEVIVQQYYTRFATFERTLRLYTGACDLFEAQYRLVTWMERILIKGRKGDAISATGRMFGVNEWSHWFDFNSAEPPSWKEDFLADQSLCTLVL